MPNDNKFSLGYRSDIEGLRALAILIVVAAHAKLPGLQGGFVGVDVFFVISGYLISGLIFTEWQESGKINLTNFYARRLRRLLPALIFMLVSVSFISILYLSSSGFALHARVAIAASVWMSNMHFALSDINYFEQDSSENLFLHTWSLGVEEQFYLIWPPLIILLFARAAKRKIPKNIFTTLAVIVGLGFVFSLALSYTLPLLGFYLMPSRIWQFALGALILKVSISNRDCLKMQIVQNFENKYLSYSKVLGWIGLGLIVFSTILFTEDMIYPGIWAVFPSLGAALVLLSGAVAPNIGVANVLSFGPMRWIGKISYSWYLWHWPILVLGAILFVNQDTYFTYLLLALSLLIATISFWIIESPIRHNKTYQRKPKLTIAVSAGAMIFSVFLMFFWQEKSLGDQQNKTLKRYAIARTDVPEIYSMGCDEWIHSDRVKVCSFGEAEAENTVVLIGDSIAGQWFPAVQAIYDKPNWRVLVVTKSSCPMIDEPFFYQRIGRDFTECSKWRGDALEWIKHLEPEVVLLGNTSVNFEESQWVGGTRRVLEKISKSVKNIHIMRPTFGLTFEGPSCLERLEKNSSEDKNDCRSETSSELHENIKQWLLKVSGEFSNVSLIDMNDTVCPDNWCYAERNNKVIYRDSQHLTASYILSISPVLEEKISSKASK